MKWIKHDTNSSRDGKLMDVLIEYGVEGFGLYWYCVELIANKVSKEDLSFKLDCSVKAISYHTKVSIENVDEMLSFFVKIGLFERTEDNQITCFKIASRLDKSMTSNAEMREIISKIKNKKTSTKKDETHDDDDETHDNDDETHDSVSETHDSVMTKSAKPMQDKNRLDKNRLDKSRKDNSSKEKKKEKAFTPTFECLGISSSDAEEIIRIRKANGGGKITKRVEGSLIKQFQLAMDWGMVLNDILDEWESRGWKMFKFEWTDAKKSGEKIRKPGDAGKDNYGNQIL